ncbi:MAG: bifunctional enoyl-CoA hydratase/phosphate acetyltransferase [Acetobacteraceae bacterium]|nr:bifunctional enoyl-CoA hydratase/phosphate acetyltransferase [Acetobacteraceae bacterium]
MALRPGTESMEDFPRFLALLEKARGLGPVTVSVAAAGDRDLLVGVQEAVEAGVARPVLVGDEGEVRRAAGEAGLAADTPVVAAADPREAALGACRLVREGRAQVVMKGMVSSTDFLRAVLHPQHGLRAGRTLSHVAVYDVPGWDRLALMTDGGMIPAPDLSAKRDILQNAVDLARALGVAEPRVAVLSATEIVDPAIPSTVDAARLKEMALSGEIQGAIVDGPLALDMAFSAEIAERKGMKSAVAGRADIFLVPCIEAGNILGKAFMYLAGAAMAGVVMGGLAPAVLNSRVDTPVSRLSSLVVASLLVHAGAGRLREGGDER